MNILEYIVSLSWIEIWNLVRLALIIVGLLLLHEWGRMKLRLMHYRDKRIVKGYEVPEKKWKEVVKEYNEVSMLDTLNGAQKMFLVLFTVTFSIGTGIVVTLMFFDLIFSLIIPLIDKI